MTDALSAREAVAQKLDPEAWEWITKARDWSIDTETWETWQRVMKAGRDASLSRAEALLALPQIAGLVEKAGAVVKSYDTRGNLPVCITDLEVALSQFKGDGDGR